MPDIARGDNASLGNDFAGNTVDKNFAFTLNAAGLVLFGLFDQSGLANPISGVDWNGVPMTLLGHKAGGGSTRFVELWAIYSTATGTHNFTVHKSGAAVYEAGAWTYTNTATTTAGATPTVQPYSLNSSTANNLNGPITTTVNRSWTTAIGWAIADTGSAGGAPSTLWFRPNGTGGTVVLDSNGVLTPAGATQLEITGTGFPSFALIVVEIAGFAGSSSPSASQSPSASVSPSSSPSPSLSPSASQSPSSSVSPSVSPSSSQSPSSSVSPSVSPSSSPSPSTSPSASQSPSASTSPSHSASPSSSPSPSPSPSAGNSPSTSPSSSQSPSSSPSPSVSPSSSPSRSLSPSASVSPSVSPSASTSPSSSPSASPSPSAAEGDADVTVVPEAAIEIRPDDLVIQGPNEARVYMFDWDRENLASGVTIDDSVFTITSVRPSGNTALAKDNEDVLADERKTWLRLSAGTLGATYRISNRITTNESPAQTKELSFFLKIEYR